MSEPLTGDSLDDRLAALRQAMTDLEPPARVEAALARAATRRARAIRRRPWWQIVLPVALAASTAGVVLLHRGTPSDAPPLPTSAGSADRPGNAFVPLVPVAELERSGEALVVAMDLPRASLAEFGVVASPARAADSIPAELLIRPDGAVLAIRFIP